MARLVFLMNVSLDGYVDHEAFGPSPALFRHFIEVTQEQTGVLYGRGLYEIMRYFDDDRAEWDAARWEYARAWRRAPKWVVSTTLREVGPNATLIGTEVERAVRGLKADLPGEIGIGGTGLAQSLGELGLVDEYRLYLHPVVLGRGTPFFKGPLPRLRLRAQEMVADVVRLSYVPE